MPVETAANIPVIDISSSNIHAAKQILEAASTWGFVYVKNDGTDISYDDLRQMFHAVRTPQSIISKSITHTSIVQDTLRLANSRERDLLDFSNRLRQEPWLVRPEWRNPQPSGAEARRLQGGLQYWGVRLERATAALSAITPTVHRACRTL